MNDRKTLRDIDLAGRTVLMRVDFNVPLVAGRIASDRRIAQALPTIRHALDGGARLVLMSHLGRPAENGFEAEFSMAPVAECLARHLGKTIPLGPQSVVGPDLEAKVLALEPGAALLMENLRFDPGEQMPDKAEENPDGKLTPHQQALHDAFASAIARLGDVYVNDAFGTCHRQHASMYAVPKAIRAAGGPAVAGFLVEKEIRYLDMVLRDPRDPFVAVLGGAKVSDKIKLISRLLPRVDRLLIGGAMAYTLLHARGIRVGASRVEKDQVEHMRGLLAAAGDKVVLPMDHVATDWFRPKPLSAGTPVAIHGPDIPDGLMGLDVGPATVAAFGNILRQAGTIVWNGPMGVFELESYAAGTRSIARLIAESTDRGALTVIGGGDSASAVEALGLEGRMTHVSTGGGASIKFLEGKPMPPLEVLDAQWAAGPRAAVPHHEALPHRNSPGTHPPHDIGAIPGAKRLASHPTAPRKPRSFLVDVDTVARAFAQAFGTQETIQASLHKHRPGNGYAKFSIGRNQMLMWFDTSRQHSDNPAPGGSISEGTINGSTWEVQFRCLETPSGEKDFPGLYNAIRMFVDRLEPDDAMGPLLDGFRVTYKDKSTPRHDHLHKALGDRVPSGQDYYTFRFRPSAPATHP